MAISLRKSNIESLVQSGVVQYKKKDKGVQEGFYFNPAYMGSDSLVDLDGLIIMCELLAAQRDVVFRFWFNPQEEHFVWHGGIYQWREPITPPPSTASQEDIDAFNARNIPVERLLGKWLTERPDVTVFDKDLPNLFCQLMTAFIELFEEEDFFKGVEEEA